MKVHLFLFVSSQSSAAEFYLGGALYLGFLLFFLPMVGCCTFVLYVPVESFTLHVS